MASWICGLLSHLKKIFLLAALVAGTGCTFSGSIGRFGKGSSTPQISGALKVGLSSLSFHSQCASPKVRLFKIGTDGLRQSPFLAETELKPDGSYLLRVEDLDLLGDPEGQTLKAPLLVELSGCGTLLSRRVTGLREQNISYGSALIGYMENTPHGSALADNGTAGLLKGLLSRLETETSFEDAYARLSGDAESLAAFQTFFSVAPAALEEAAPFVGEIEVGGPLEEGVPATVSLEAQHWRTAYAKHFVWQLDGVTFAQGGDRSSVPLSPTENSQGERILTVKVGQASGMLVDETKPFRIRSRAVVVANTRPAEPPPLSVIGSEYVNTADISLQLDTGAGLAHCASFSHLQLTENTEDPPSSTSSFPLDCSVPVSQTIPYTLPGEGTWTLRLWAVDSSGQVSATSRAVTVHYRTEGPSVAFVAPAANSYVGASVAVAGTCETASGNVSLTGAGLAASATAPCVDGEFSATLSLSAGEGTKNIEASQTDAYGVGGQATRSFIRDETSPAGALAFAGLGASPSAVTTARTITLTLPSDATHYKILTVQGGDCSAPGLIDVLRAEAEIPAGQTYPMSVTAQGAHTLCAIARDEAGNWQSSVSQSAVLVIDSVAPILTLDSPGDGARAQSNLVVDGSCEEGLPVLFAGSGLLASFSQPCSGGAYSQTLFFSNGDGPKEITVSQTDAAGNTASRSKVFHRDTAAPQLTQDLLNSPAWTQGNQVVFGGTCEADLTVSVLRDGVPESSAACSAGMWNYAVSPQTTDASRAYRFEQRDEAGNTGAVNAIWVRDTVAPPLIFSSSSAFLTSTNIVTFSGTCESGLTIVVSGDVTTTRPCTGGNWTFAPTATTDGVRNYTLRQTDPAGNETTLSAQWTRDTSAPNLTVTSALTVVNKLDGTHFEGTCEDGLPIEVTGSATETLVCEDGFWSYDPAAMTDGDRVYTLRQTNPAMVTVSVTLNWKRDNLPPVAGAISSSPSGLTTRPELAFSFSATDATSDILYFCLSLSSAVPDVSDSCWRSVGASPPGLAPAPSLSVSGYKFNVGLTPGTYDVHVFYRDEAGNISASTGSAGVDVLVVVYEPGSDPVIPFVYATKSPSPNAPLSKAEQIVGAGNSVHLKWRAYDSDPSGLLPSPIQVQVSYDNRSWTNWGGAIANAGNGCAPDGGGTLDDGATGCIVLTAPTSDFFNLRVVVTDTTGRSASRSANPLNTSPLRIVAGNMDRGVNNSARSAVFTYDEDVQTNNSTNRQSFVVLPNGDIYLITPGLGVFVIKAADGVLRPFLKLGTARILGAVSGAVLLDPLRLVLDPKNRLLIWDKDLIVRVDLELQTLVPLIGGGESSADTLAEAKDLKLRDLDRSLNAYVHQFYMNDLVALPSGEIFFKAWPNIHEIGGRIQIYREGANPQITSLQARGTGISSATGIDIASCPMRGLAFQYDLNTGSVEHVVNYTYGSVTYAGCPEIHKGISQLDFDTFENLGFDPPMPPVGGGSFYTGQDGRIYYSSRYQSRIWRLNLPGGVYAPVVGTGVTGSCPEKTQALSCATEFRDLFVDSNGKIYWWEKSRLRTLNAADEVVTLYGQSLSYGDGLNPLLARFNKIKSFDRSDAGDLFILDYAEVTLRKVDSTFSTISHLAGTGLAVSPAAGSVAQTSNLLANSLHTGVVVDRSTGLPYTMGSHTYLKLDSGGVWRNSGIGRSTGTIYSAADGMAGGDIRLAQDSGAASGSYKQLLGWSPLGLYALSTTRLSGGSRTDSMIKHYRHADLVQTHVLGKIGTDPTGYCVPSVAGVGTSVCGVPRSDYAEGHLRPVFDEGPTGSAADDRVLIVPRQTSRVISVEGNVARTLLSVAHPVLAFTYHRGGGEEFLLYCSGTDQKIHKYDFLTDHEEELEWTVPNTECSGHDIHYDPAARAAYFIGTRDGLSAIMEIVVP